MRITLSLSPGTAKRSLFLASTLAVLAAASLAYAELPPDFKATDVLTADALNKRFGPLDARLTAVETKPALDPAKPVIVRNAVQYSLGATFHSATAPTAGLISFDGKTGYEAAKGLCVDKVGSPSAHMCTSEEISRTRQMGLPVSAGWYAAAVYFYNDGNSADSHECKGWTSATQGAFIGPRWDSTAQNGPSIGLCSELHPVLCCD